MQKNGKVRGSHGKFDWKSRDSTSRKSVSSTGGKMDLPKSPCKLINKNKKRFFFFKYRKIDSSRQQHYRKICFN